MILRLNTNSSCNLDCIHCYYKTKVWFDWSYMNYEDAKNILIQAKEIFWDTLKVVFMWWWEPLLYNKLFDLLEFAKINNIKSAITTNWILLNDTKIQKLKSFWTEIIISIEWNEEYNDSVRGIWISLKLNKILNKLKEEKLFFWINFTLSKNNILQIPYLVAKYTKLTNFITFSRFIPYTKSFIKPLSNKDYMLLETILTKYKNIWLKFRQEKFFKKNIKKDYIFDIKNLHSLYILPNKTIYPAWNLIDYKLWDLNNDTLINILNNWKLEKLYNPENLRWEKCSKCDYKYSCSWDRGIAYFYTWDFWWDDIQCPYFLK